MIASKDIIFLLSNALLGELEEGGLYLLNKQKVMMERKKICHSSQMVNCPHHVTMCDGVKLYGITNNVGGYTGSFEEFPCPFLYVFVHTCSCTMDLHCLTFAVYKMGCFAAFLKFLPAFKLVFFLILQRKIL